MSNKDPLVQVLVPMAGQGSRFSNENYQTHKACLPVYSSKFSAQVPMVVQSVCDLPVDLNKSNSKVIFVVRDFHVTDGSISEIMQHFKSSDYTSLSDLTQGQAITCQSALPLIDISQPLFVCACDNGMVIDHDYFLQIALDSDAIVFAFKDDPVVEENPQAYGWVKTVGDRVTGVSVKQPISDTPMLDYAISGCFWFREGKIFFDLINKMIENQDTINNEYYVDQIFNYFDVSSKIRVMPVEKYICWGTPRDYEKNKNYYKDCNK